MKRALSLGLSTLIGAALMTLWWSQYGSDVEVVGTAQWEWLLAGLLCVPLVLWLQLQRTVRLLSSVNRQALSSAVLLSHGMNVLLPSLLGDAYEVTSIAQHAQLQKRSVLIRLLHRLGSTLSALGLLMAIALSTIEPNIAFFVLVGSFALPYIVDGALPRIADSLGAETVAPLGAAETSVHIILAMVQHTVSALSVFCLGLAINDAVSPTMSAAMLSIADLVTYLPVPLGGVGVNHWSVTTICDRLGQIPAALVAFNHAMVVLVGGVSAAIGLATKPKTMHNS